MPRKFHLCWEAPRQRWRVQHQCRRFAVSCAQLAALGYLDPNAPPTKKASYHAANRWWSEHPASRPEVRMPAGPGGVDAAPVPPIRPRHSEPIGPRIEAWKDDQTAQARAGRISEAEARNRHAFIAHFQTWIGGSATLDDLDEARWHAWHRFLSDRLADGTWKPETARKLFHAARMFIRSLVYLNLIRQPANLDDRALRFSTLR